MFDDPPVLLRARSRGRATPGLLAAVLLGFWARSASAQEADAGAPVATEQLTGNDVTKVYGVATPEQAVVQARGEPDAGPPTPEGDAKSAAVERHVADLMDSFVDDRPFDSPGFLIHDNNYFSILTAGDKPTVKFQVSVRYEILNLGIIRGYSWSFAYTQKALWDLFNFEDSAPFLENNYKPEMFFGFRPKRQRYTEEYAIGVMHESNGLGLTDNGDSRPASKSWNNVYVSARRHLSPILGLGRFRYQFVGALRAWYPFGVSAGEYPDDMKQIERETAKRMQKNISYASLSLDVRFGSSWLYRNQKLANESRGLFRVLAKVRSAEVSLYIPFPAKGWIQASLYAQLFAGKVEYLMLYDTQTVNFYLGLGLL